MAIKNLKKALGVLEKEKGKSKKKRRKVSSNKHIKKQNNKKRKLSINKQIKRRKKKHIKKENNKKLKAIYQSIKLDPDVKRKLWLNRINTGETITAAINRIVGEYFK
jgi:hypothetical protein